MAVSDLRTDAEKHRMDDKSLAIAAETLFVLNLLLLPGLGFAALFALYVFNIIDASPLARNHLGQTVGVCTVGGGAIVAALALSYLLGAFHTPGLSTGVVIYLVFIHLPLIACGLFGLYKSIRGERFIYPLIGRYFAH